MRRRRLVWCEAIALTAIGLTAAVVLAVLPSTSSPRPLAAVSRDAFRPALPVAPVSRPAVRRVQVRPAVPGTSVMPITWDDAFTALIDAPDEAALERGEVLYDARSEDGGTVAQTMGLIDATPEECLAVVRDYEHYTLTMPFTDESHVVRTFRLDGPIDPGAEAVDFWTRVNVGGLKTRYLVRIAHLVDRSAHRYRSYWTLVGDPGRVGTDGNGKPFVNDLAVDVGAHLFEPLRDAPLRTRHTYTLRVEGRGWRKTLMTASAGNSMKEVTRRIRLAAEERHGARSPRP